MSSGSPAARYVLGNTDAEYERLIRQAARLAPCTERLLCDAGIGLGQRVLDIGSGLGDVAMLAARRVGPSGEVVGIESAPRAIARARARIAQAGLHNVTFTECDVRNLNLATSFDAVVGRFILEFLPDPASVLHSLVQFIRPGGVVAFHEPAYDPFYRLSVHLPLWTAATSLIREVLGQSGANTEIGASLCRIFDEAGLPQPVMTMEVLLGNDPEIIRLVVGMLGSLWPQIKRMKLPHRLGDYTTLGPRLQAEIAASKTTAFFVALIGAWSRKPT